MFENTIKRLVMTPEKAAEIREKLPPEFPLVSIENMLSLDDPSINWQDLSTHKHLTCFHHPWMRMITKNVWSRSIFTLQGKNGLDTLIDDECDCGIVDLRVVRKGF